MTALEAYSAVLVEMNKENAPNILLEDFNYFINKAINNYINKHYSIYDINLQLTDDLRVLKSTAFLTPTIATYEKDESEKLMYSFMGATYTVDLPQDYMHLLNCICIYEVSMPYKCYNKGSYWRRAATRLTADLYSLVLDNFWLRPTYKRPYYYIHNINTSEEYPYNPIKEEEGTDVQVEETEDTIRNGRIILEDETPRDYITISKDIQASSVQRSAGLRYGNVSPVRMEIRYGSDTSVFLLKKVLVDYIKTPQHIRLTQDQLDKTEDTSQTLEFPDYVCQEIINELVHIIMENISDLRILTHPIVTLSIANPVQQLAQQPAALTAQ